MGHCPYNKLNDLSEVLKSIASYPGIKEKTPGVFYYKSIPFLHFHLKDDLRWADVKHEKIWVKVDIPIDATAMDRAKFSKEVLKYFKWASKAAG